MAMALTRGEAWTLAARSLLLQVLLNYRTMQGGGYLFTLWPWLRKTRTKAPEVRACGNYLNAHPVLATLAIGALRRRVEERDTEQDPAAFAEWQNTLCGPLGVMGDALIWDRWKPILFSLGVFVMLWRPTLETWYSVAVGTLLLYNLPLIYLRVWGVRAGYRLGADVLLALQRPLFSRVRRILSIAGAITAGLLLAGGLVRTATDSLLPGGQFLVAFAAALLGIRLRWSLTWLIFVSIGVAILLPFAVSWLQ